MGISGAQKVVPQLAAQSKEISKCHCCQKQKIMSIGSKRFQSLGALSDVRHNTGRQACRSLCWNSVELGEPLEAGLPQCYTVDLPCNQGKSLGGFRVSALFLAFSISGFSMVSLSANSQSLALGPQPRWCRGKL